MNLLHTTLATLTLMAAFSGITLADTLPGPDDYPSDSTTSISGSEINVITSANDSKIYATNGGTVDVGGVVSEGAQISNSKITVITDIKNTEIYADGDSNVSVGTVRLK